MQGIQKVKCTSCGTMFMSEIGINMCPSCSQQSHGEQSLGGCGCGQSH